MALKAPANCPSSSSEATGTSWSRLPAPMAMADSVTARIGTRIVRIVPATRSTAKAMPKARPPPYQQGGAGPGGAPAIGRFHVLLVDPQNVAGDALDLEEQAVKTRLVAAAEIQPVPLASRWAKKSSPCRRYSSLSRVKLVTRFPSPGKVMLCCSLSRLCS